MSYPFFNCSGIDLIIYNFLARPYLRYQTYFSYFYYDPIIKIKGFPEQQPVVSQNEVDSFFSFPENKHYELLEY